MQKFLIFFLFLTIIEIVFGHGHLAGNQKIHSASEVKHLVRLQKAAKATLNARSEKFQKAPKVRFWASNYVNDYLVLNITVGTPAKKFNVAIETASRNLWLLDPSVGQSSATKNFYDSTKSKTSTKRSGNFEETSGPYSIFGDNYKDSINLGGEYDFDQNFGSVLDFSPKLKKDFPLDGGLGLQWDPTKIQWTDDAAPIINLLEPCDKRWITVWIGPHLAPSKGVSPYEITLGRTDNTHCEKGLHFIPLTTFSGIIDQLAVKVDSFSFATYKSQPNELATTDSGFPVIQLGALEFFQINMLTNAVYDFDLELLTVPCKSTSTFSDLVFTINGADYSIPAINYVVDMDIDDGTTCALAISLNQDTSEYPSIVLGNPFMRTYCTTYNVDATSISFSKALNQ